MCECRQQKHTQHASSTKTDCDYLYGWIINSHIRKNLPQNGEPQRSSREHKRMCDQSQKVFLNNTIPSLAETENLETIIFLLLDHFWWAYHF